MAYYLDTSAALKLVVPEAETAALRRWLSRNAAAVVSSDLLRTEMLRAVRRHAPRRMARARVVLDSIIMMALPTETFEHAGELEPATLRSLDAVHLAAALALGDDLDGIVTYDDRLAQAAEARGLVVIAPR